MLRKSFSTGRQTPMTLVHFFSTIVELFLRISTMMKLAVLAAAAGSAAAFAPASNGTVFVEFWRRVVLVHLYSNLTSLSVQISAFFCSLRPCGYQPCSWKVKSHSFPSCSRKLRGIRWKCWIRPPFYFWLLPCWLPPWGWAQARTYVSTCLAWIRCRRSWLACPRLPWSHVRSLLRYCPRRRRWIRCDGKHLHLDCYRWNDFMDWSVPNASGIWTWAWWLWIRKAIPCGQDWGTNQQSQASGDHSLQSCHACIRWSCHSVCPLRERIPILLSEQ